MDAGSFSFFSNNESPQKPQLFPMEVTGLVHVCINVTEQRCGQISPRIDETLEKVWGGSSGLNEWCFFW